MTSEEVEPRLAATVVLLRDGRGGPEVLLTRRPPSMAFAADMHVFPGGRLDPGDSEPALVERAATEPAEAAAALGGDLDPSVAIGLRIAAIRELFEEAGVLLADARDGALAPRSVSQARTALVGGDASFAQIARGAGIEKVLEPRDEVELGHAYDRMLAEDGPFVVPVKVVRGRAEGRLDRDVVGYTRRFRQALAVLPAVR
jgi:8-oxo-dGTP pyrophosphatase MutT (NUDIX family)